MENNSLPMIYQCEYQSGDFSPMSDDAEEGLVELIQFCSSSGHIVSDSGFFPFSTGSLALLSNRQLYAIEQEDPEDCICNHILLSEKCLDLIMELCGFQPDWKDTFQNNCHFLFRLATGSTSALAVDQLFRKAAKSMQDDQRNYFRQAAVIECVIQILRIAYSSEAQEQDAAKHSRVSLYNQLEEYLNNRRKVWDSISMDDICATLHISPSYAAHLFKKLTNKSITQYTTDLRIAEAQRLLRTTNLKIYEIAEKLQFHNTTIFCKTFRKCVQCTPKQYRDSAGT